MEPVTIEEHEAELSELRASVRDIDNEYAGRELPPEQRSAWNDANEAIDKKVKLIAELRAREERVREVTGAADAEERSEGLSFHTKRSGIARGDDIYDLSTLRSVGSEEELRKQYRDRVLFSVEGAKFPHERANREDVQGHIERMLDQFSGDESDSDSLPTFARRVLNTGAPLYRKAFTKALVGKPLTSEEQRALSLTGSAGGYAVPYTLDPTIIPTSNSSVNPLRAISRVEQITGNEWRGVSSGAVSVSYGAEAAEASDNSPTLAQPTANVEKAQAFIPFSVEVGGDWGAIQAEIARLIQDGKDDVEATKFISGAGHGSNEPEGLLTGATGTVAAGTAAFAVSHLYSLTEALAPRFEPRASFVAHNAQYNRVRQFDTSGGANLWEFLGAGTPARLLGYNAYKASAMASVLTAGSKIMTFGDFSYFLIVDRIGMDVELVPHLFGASGRPTGQRGFYAWYRNTSKVLSASAFKTLQTT